MAIIAKNNIKTDILPQRFCYSTNWCPEITKHIVYIKIIIDHLSPTSLLYQKNV